MLQTTGDGAVALINANADGVELRISASARQRDHSSVRTHSMDSHPLRRILCSATLTRDPDKLAALSLRFPVHVGEGGKETDEYQVHKRPFFYSLFRKRANVCIC